MNRRSRWALAFRLARREARRHPWRQVLVVALIFLPALLTLVAFSAVDTFNAVSSRVEAFDAGTSSYDVITGPDVPDAGPDSSDALAGRDIVRRAGFWKADDWIVTTRQRADGLGPVLVSTDATGPLDAAARDAVYLQYRVDEGRLPATASEVLVTRSLADRAGLSVGDRIETAASRHTLIVTGVGRQRANLGSSWLVVGPGPATGWVWALRPSGSIGDNPATHYDRIWERTQLAARPFDPFTGGSQYDEGHWPDGTFPLTRTVDSISILGPAGVGLALAGAVLAVLAATLTSTAFAMASRRQLRSVGLLTTAGADPGLVRMALVLQGLIPGVAAGVGALAVTMAAAAALDAGNVAERVSRVDGMQVVVSTPGALLAIAVAAGAGVLAAWFPARGTSRIPVLSALASRRPVAPLRLQMPLLGVASFGGGLLLLGYLGRRLGDLGPITSTVLPFLAVVLLVVGAVGTAPALVVATERIGGRLGGTTRLGLRGLTRGRGQTSAAIVAVAVCLAVPVSAATVASTYDRARDRRSDEVQRATDAYEEANRAAAEVTPVDSTLAGLPALTGAAPLIVRFDGAADGARIDRLLSSPAVPVASRSYLTAAGTWTRVATVDPQRAALGFSPTVVAALRSGHAVRVRTAGRGPSEGSGYDGTGLLVADQTIVPRVVDVRDPTLEAGFDLLVPDGLVPLPRRADVEVRRWSFRSTPLSVHEVSLLTAGDGGPTLQEIRDGIGWRDGWWVQSGWTQTASPAESVAFDRKRTWVVIAVALSTAFTLVAVAIALSLRSVDQADDRRSAIAAGADPGRLRRLTRFEGTTIVLLGVLLALPLGWAPTAVVLGRPHVSTSKVPFPNPTLAIVPVLVVPAVVVFLLWTIVPWLRSLPTRRTHDLLLPRT